MATTRLETYTVPEVCQILGIQSKNDAYEMIDKGTFPFSVVQIGPRNWRVHKKQVDKYIATGELPELKKTGRPKKWVKGEYIWYKYRVPLELDDEFKAVCEYLNARMDNPADLDDYRRIAIREFVQRRPIPEDEKSG